jgi:hypothetical protein
VISSLPADTRWLRHDSFTSDARLVHGQANINHQNGNHAHQILKERVVAMIYDIKIV